MAGYNLPDDFSQAAFDRYWANLDGDEDDRCPDCGGIPCVCELDSFSWDDE